VIHDVAGVQVVVMPPLAIGTPPGQADLPLALIERGPGEFIVPDQLPSLAGQREMGGAVERLGRRIVRSREGRER
jgi:hypothetical protein